MPDDLTYHERYERGITPWDSGQPSVELVRHLDVGNLPGKTILDIGCGTGTNAIELARRGYRVTAFDYVAQPVEIAKERARAAGVKIDFLVADALKDDLGGPYDVLFDRGVYHSLRQDNLPAFQAQLRKVTRPGSWWLSLAGNSKEKHEPGPPVVSESEIRSELGGLFDIVELCEFRLTTNDPNFRPLAWSILMRRK